MTWDPKDEEGNEAGKVRWEIVRYTRGKGLDVGCGPFKAFAHFTGVDSRKDVELFGTEMTPDVVAEADALPFDLESQDFVFSSHLLEHIADIDKALKEWWRVLKVGGHLVLYLPHKHLYPNIGEPGANPDHRHDFLPVDIMRNMRRLFPGWTLLVNQTRNEGTEYSFLQVYRKDAEPGHREPWGIAPKGKRACIVRYGGFGDQLQAASIRPGLKAQGFHITFMTTPKGKAILDGNPFVDDWFLQDTDQVPNQELGPYWHAQAKHYHRFINLSESIEGTLLAIPGRANHAWPDQMRRKYLGVNYLEFTAELAQVKYDPPFRLFFPTAEEVAWATDFVKDMPIPIMFTLSGSSQHKFYPHMDQVIADLLKDPRIHVITTGDLACQILECGLDQLGPRVHLMSDRIDIRKTLALAQACTIVMGPETGVLNGVAFEPQVGKVILLSHSSVENLTRDWVNTVSILPPSTPCYPCHRLHYTRLFCPEHKESGAAVCQWDISPRTVTDGVFALLKAMGEKEAA